MFKSFKASMKSIIDSIPDEPDVSFESSKTTTEVKTTVVSISEEELNGLVSRISELEASNTQLLQRSKAQLKTINELLLRVDELEKDFHRTVKSLRKRIDEDRG